jgi:hypothetical protein
LGTVSKFFRNQAVFWQSLTVPSAGLCHWCWPPPCEKGRRLIDIHLCLTCFVGRRVAGQPVFACASPSHRSRISTGSPCCSSLPRVRIPGQVVHIVYTPPPEFSWPFRFGMCWSLLILGADVGVHVGQPKGGTIARAASRNTSKAPCIAGATSSFPRHERCAAPSGAALRWQRQR